MDASKLSIGAFGQGVATVQTALQSLGYDIGASELQRSFFGPVTRRAVQQFQKETGLAVSGKVDPQTAAAINAAATAARTMAAPSIGVRAAPIAQPVAPMPTSPPALLTPVKAIVSDAQIKSLLAASPAITSAMQARFVTLYDANTGSLSDFWAKLASDPQLGPVVPRLQLTMQLGTLTSNNPDLVTKLIAQFKPISMRDLTKVSTTQLVQLMTAENVQVPASIAATTTPATIAQYATSIVNSLKQAFPTDYVAQSFSTSTDIINQAVAAFLNKSLGFDFATTRIDTYLTANPAALAGLTADQIAALTDRLKSAQRVFRVINDGDVMQSLISLGLDSAYAIAATPSGSFLANYADTLGGQTQAQQIYANATNITGASSLIIRQAQENASGIMQKVIPGGNRGSSLSDALPNWQELFGATSTCQCCECRAIDGPAAYFVSLLQFLGGLGMNGELNTPLDVLIGNANSGHVMNGQNEIKNQVTTPRRPDLAHLKLNCANADTALPYVDLVNEILESYVANGSIGNSTAHDTPGDATTAVLDVTPEYTQTPDAVKAYKALNASSIVYPCSLPFDRYLVTVRTYLNSLGVSLYRLMQAFGSPVPPLQDATQLAAESLLISPPEYELITNQDLAGNLLALSAILADYFGYTAASALCQVTGYP
jgi:peptidoglycan hydrolase-like protein with peptidoglycan-binding domain